MFRLPHAFASVLLVAAASPAFAKDPGKAVLSKLEKGSSAAIAGLVPVLDGHRAALALKLDTVEQNVQAGATLAMDNAIFAALDAFQLDVRGAVLDSGLAFATAQKAAFADFKAQGFAASELPKGCRYGEKGPIDSFRVRIRSTLEKHYAKVEKRLAKLAKVFEDEAGIGLVCNIQPPPFTAEFAVSDISGPNYSGNIPLSLDLIVASSVLAVAGDARVILGGCAPEETEFGISWVSPGSSFGTSINGPEAGENNRWKHVWENRQEQNAIAGVFMLGGGPGATGAIGPR